MEAMVLVNELISAGYDFAVARRLYVIACEDIGPGELGLGCTDRCDICRLPDDKERCRHPTAGSEHADADGVADMPLAESREADDPKCVILERVTSKESSARKILDATPISVSTRTPNPARKR